MCKAVKTALSLVVGLVLASTLALAQAGGNSAQKTKNQNKEHHSRLKKVEFWRHHKDGGKNAKQPEQAQSKQAKAKPAQVKAVPVKQTVSTKDQKQVRHTSKVSKASAKKAPVHTAKSNPKSKPTARKHAAIAHNSVKRHPAANKTKAQKKPQEHATA
jgi:hypothetical protein